VLADDPPQVRISARICALDVDDGDIGFQGRHRDEVFSAVRIRDAPDVGIHPLQDQWQRFASWGRKGKPAAPA